MLIVAGTIVATIVALFLLLMAVGWWMFDGPGSRGASLDQQQQAWEQETRAEACEAYQQIGGKYVAMDQAE